MGSDLPAADAATILRRRAAALARPEPAPAQGLVDVLRLTIGGQGIVIELACVREVRQHRAVAPLPFAVRHVLGVASLAGRMLPVLDLAQILGLAATVPRHLAVIGRDDACFGVGVDDIRGLDAIRVADALHRAANLDNARSDLVGGVTSHGDLLLDTQRLLALRPASVARPELP